MMLTDKEKEPLIILCVLIAFASLICQIYSLSGR